MAELPTGTVTLLFTDIEGSTQLWEAHAAAMRAALARHDALLRHCIGDHHGHVFKTGGDAFCAAFHTAPDALAAALEAQSALHREPWPEGAKLRVRMALHSGAVEVRDGDYFGAPLNRVARLLAAGHGGQTLLSEATHDLGRDHLPPLASVKASPSRTGTKSTRRSNGSNGRTPNATPASRIRRRMESCNRRCIAIRAGSRSCASWDSRLAEPYFTGGALRRCSDPRGREHRPARLSWDSIRVGARCTNLPNNKGGAQMCDVCGDARHEPQVSRRDFLRTGAIGALIPWSMGVAVAADPPAPGAPPPQNAIAPADALKRLMEGNARYAANTPNERDFSSGRAARAQGQYPIAAILSCADSRVAPELLFDQAPGDLFIVRVAGNIVTPDLLASLEYGVQFLGAPFVMVLGHSACGAVDAAIKVLKTKALLPGHLPQLITAIKPAVVVAEKMQTGNLLDNAIAENVRRQVTRLKNSPSIVQKSYASKKIDIVGAVYDLATGKIALL